MSDGNGSAKCSADQDLSDRRAIEILQSHLDVTAQAMASGDFEAFMKNVTLPHYILTRSERFSVSDVEQSREMFMRIVEADRANGVTNGFRIARHARFKSIDRIEGDYESFYFRGERYASEPFMSTVTIIKDQDGHWRWQSVRNGFANLPGKYELFAP